MYSFKKSLSALIGLIVLLGGFAALMPLASQGQGKQQRGLRKFYLTQGQYDGSQALSACAEGYHMASLWEILDPSNLSYDTSLGHTRPDSGSGPPSGSSPSWIRTGSFPNTGNLLGPGVSNCQAWTSSSNTDAGTAVFLSNSWGSTSVTTISPWVAAEGSCSYTQRVSCVQD